MSDSASHKEPKFRFEPLDKKKHNRAAFSCEHERLNAYLKEQANQEIKKRVTAVYVLTPDGRTIAGYYTLSQYSIDAGELPPETIQKLQIPRYDKLPATLLERRPDVAIAERQAAAANAQIGVAESAFFPTLTLSATAGFQNSTFSKLLTAPSRFWSLGPQLAETIFSGGAREAQVAQARAGFDAAAANYREVALAAFQNVEDNLAALRILEAEAAAQADALKSAETSLAIALNQYRAGTVSYLNVVTAQTTAYSNERNAISILGNRLTDSVALIKALGGGWDATQLPAPGDIDRHSQAPQPVAH